MKQKPPMMDSGHAAEFLERAYTLQQIITAIIDSHPMAEHNDEIRDAVGGLYEAAGRLYQEAGKALIDIEDTETGT